MDYIKTAVISLIVAVATVLGVVGFTGSSSVPEAAQKLSGATPVSPYNYFVNAGVAEYFGSAGLKTATTTVCAIQSPAATSTLGSVALRLDTASSTATIWNIAVATTPYATTTALGTAYTVAGSAQAYIQASTSPAAGAATVIAPNSYIVFGAQAGITAGDTAGTGFVPAGRCRASFVTTDQ